MMKKILLATLLASAWMCAHAKPYPKHDLAKIVTPNSVNFAVAEQIYQDLRPHAETYPTKFDNAKDKAVATAEAKELARIYNGLFATKIITPQHEAYRQLLHRAARVNWMAHNLDVPQTAAYAKQHYRTLINSSTGKDKAVLMGEYGSFLAASAQTNEAETVLKQSIQAGNTAAKRQLAMVLVTQGKPAEAEKVLREYIQAFPKDTHAKTLLEAVKSGRVEINKAK